MILAGKCPPERDELEEAMEKGFENVELYIEKKHLENLDKTVENVRNSPVNVVSVHSPHVTLDDKKYFQLADQLALELDAYLVFHSQYILNINSSEIEEKLDLNSEHGFENNPGTSVHCLENSILQKDLELVLDIPHLYISEENYLEKLDYLLNSYQNKIKVIHLADSTKTQDGLGFGKGEVPMKKTVQKIKDSGFEGTVVMEVMPDKQEESKKKFEKYFKH